jgi:dihydroflavonol-4-reductase
MKYRNILITGGCGFLGQYLTKELLAAYPNCQIKILDLKAGASQLFNFHKNPRLKIILQKDICSFDSIVDEFINIDLVIHLAGLVSFSLKDKDRLFKVNVEGTRNVLKATIQNNIKHLIHVSSVAALGYTDSRANFVNENSNFDWSIAEKRKKFYMLTKYLADREVQKYPPPHLNSVIVYPGLMFGPGDLTNSVKLINAIAQHKIPFNMPGGTNIIDVRDVSRGIISTLNHNIDHGRFLLSGSNLTFKQINETIARTLAVKPPRRTLSRILAPLLFRILLLIEKCSKKKLQLTADNLDSAFKLRYFDNIKAKRELNWKPEIKFEQTIQDTMEWMKANDLLKR